MKLFKLMNRFLLFLVATLSLIACDKPDEPDTTTPPSDNYIKSGNDYFPLKSAVAIYDNTFSGKTLFTLELTSDNVGNEDLARFDYLLVTQTTILPNGSFTFFNAANVSQFQDNKFHDIYLRFGKTDKGIIDSRINTIQSSSLQIQKANNEYQIKGTIIKDGKSIEVSYKGMVDHMEAW